MPRTYYHITYGPDDADQDDLNFSNLISDLKLNTTRSDFQAIDDKT